MRRRGLTAPGPVEREPEGSLLWCLGGFAARWSPDNLDTSGLGQRAAVCRGLPLCPEAGDAVREWYPATSPELQSVSSSISLGAGVEEG